MKIIFFIILTSFSILFSSYALSATVTTVTTVTCMQGCQPAYCVEPENPCACADNGWRYNDCISKRKYCEAFGNIGAL